MVIVLVSGKLKYLKPDICCLQMLFLITIIIIESKMNILWCMYMPFSDTIPDTCILYYRNDEPMWCHSLSKWRYLYKAARCELPMRLHYRIFRHKLSRYNITCLVGKVTFFFAICKILSLQEMVIRIVWWYQRGNQNR